jgi:hypothetical protein
MFGEKADELRAEGLHLGVKGELHERYKSERGKLNA